MSSFSKVWFIDFPLEEAYSVASLGRFLSAPTKVVSEQEALSLIRHGASHVFSSKGSTVSDADIETILAESEKRVSSASSIFSTLAYFSFLDTGNGREID